MSIRTLAARGLSFAHLAGITSRAARAEDDEPEEKDRAEDDESEDDNPDNGSGSKGKKGKRAEDRDDKDPEADEETDDEEDDKDSGSGKKGKRANDGDDEEDDSDPDAEDDDGEMRGKSSAARARRREQARCAAIFGSKAAARNPVLAANLAFKTRMTRAEAISTLEATPASASAAHVNRAARNPNVGVTGGAKPSPQQATAARWDANLQAANPSKRR